MKEIRTVGVWIPVLSLGSLAHTDRLVFEEPLDRPYGRRRSHRYSSGRGRRFPLIGREDRFYRTCRQLRDR